MAKDEDEDFDDEELEEEELEEEEEEPKKKKKSPIADEIKKPTEERFAVYHYPEKVGIIDKLTNKTVGEDVFSILANMMNKLQRIDEAVG
jgi:hypothetical protein